MSLDGDLDSGKYTSQVFRRGAFERLAFQEIETLTCVLYTKGVINDN